MAHLFHRCTCADRDIRGELQPTKVTPSTPLSRNKASRGLDPVQTGPDNVPPAFSPLALSSPALSELSGMPSVVQSSVCAIKTNIPWSWNVPLSMFLQQTVALICCVLHLRGSYLTAFDTAPTSVTSCCSSLS
jgi:hypothetical protein